MTCNEVEFKTIKSNQLIRLHLFVFFRNACFCCRSNLAKAEHASEQATMASSSAEIKIAPAETRVAELESALNQVHRRDPRGNFLSSSS